jgi:Aerobic-type carbon monoxide dehydrogenase, large subunit CoxL/CutL homologs
VSRRTRFAFMLTTSAAASVCATRFIRNSPLCFWRRDCLGARVKWVGTRPESILSDHHGRAAKLTGALALDADGNFLGIRIEWLVNMGAYASNAGPFINTGAAPTSTAINAYRIPAAYGSHQLVFTNTTPTTAYRGAGRPNVAYLAERLVDEAARITGIDRIACAATNLTPEDGVPYKTPTGSTYDSGDRRSF